MQLENSRATSLPVNPNLSHNVFSTVTQNTVWKSHSTSLQPFVYFRAQISFSEYSFPVQKFSLIEKDDSIQIENFPTNSFPKVKIVLKKDSDLKVEQFNVFPSDNSVQGEILYTRFFLLAADSKKCSLNFNDIDFAPFNFGFSEISVVERTRMIYRAKLFRKLGFIERVFEKTKFNAPENITPPEAQQIEILFRGLTEGNFLNPSDSFVNIYNYKVTNIDLQNDFLFSKREFSLAFNENFFLLGRFFEVGKVLIRLEKACIANPRKIKNVKENEIIPQLKLNLYDSQIFYTFEKYKNTERLSKNVQKLERFKMLLQNEEPEFLSSLLTETLAEIDAKSAIEILETLLQYYDFPDRFTVLKPELKKNQWRIPIALTYPQKHPILLADAFVNVKTGEVGMKISFDALLKKGKRKAKEVFSIA